MSKAQGKSFTFRVPLDVHEILMARVGERNRSQFVVQALKQALGLTDENSGSVEPGLDLPAKIIELTYRLEIMKTEQDKILQRLTTLEAVSSTLQTKDVVQSKTEKQEPDVLQNSAESKTEDKRLPQNLTLQLDGIAEVKEHESSLIPSGDLLKLLEKEQPQKQWDAGSLRNYREGSKAMSWHTVGRCEFKYADKRQRIAGRNQHLWLVIHPSLNHE